ncbi:zinc finger matrin-type protein 5 [Cephus cinctus]|uniref:Zinc finger matrin-type protein 5 n=1 Tax=Cephus cinctus TaxID=211228 RepID=A0AAJ7FUU0_CEPCN|nr:zinc finger matrin-type protein 5 [Cephus cinctus]
MGKRYYCDYCDRSFKDDSEARKKHISSLQHAKNRADHYSLFKAPETILKEESEKIPCKRYMTHGDCAFGNGCKFSHYTPPMIWELQRIVAQKNQSRSMRSLTNKVPGPDEIIKEFFENTADPDIAQEINTPLWSLPIELQNYTSLPPSLWPITAESVTHSEFGKWGL